MNAIFQSTEQALHVSFLVMSVPAMGDNKFRKFLIQMLESASDDGLSDWDIKTKGKWLEQLIGTPSGTIDFSGLNQLEIRGQCAMITAAVRDRLPSTESAALLARYGIGDDQQKGIVRLALHARRSCGLGVRACGKLTARHYLPTSRRDSLSFRDLADEFKVTKDKMHRAAIWMTKHYSALERLAVSRLDPQFKAQGVVGTEEFHADVMPRREPLVTSD
ncbi:hypothetical protein KDW37_29010 [Burkholderia cenocepacia]|uniref:hypothetical protein n=1 Tax=Burkholderia cenocepacia TaxID=95486 RepID=UPI001BA066F6|nr:hypothetical protein [Burkholderia cenocepacia]MBR8434807.1 hypothetical protein [Burkholderia cenocepacia]